MGNCSSCTCNDKGEVQTEVQVDINNQQHHNGASNGAAGGSHNGKTSSAYKGNMMEIHKYDTSVQNEF
jgi:hypothetical protein